MSQLTSEEAAELKRLVAAATAAEKGLSAIDQQFRRYQGATDAALQELNEAQALKSGGGGRRGGGHSAWESTGAKHAQEKFNIRYLAMSDPGAYHTKREQALDAIKTAVEGSYNSAYTAFRSSGYDDNTAHLKATEAAHSTNTIQMDAMNSLFGDVDGIFVAQQTRVAEGKIPVGAKIGSSNAPTMSRKTRKRKT